MRRISYVHRWFLAVTPPKFLIYAVLHMYLWILYIGQTHFAACQRLRKHQTDAAAGMDGSTLGTPMAQPDPVE